MTTFNRPKILPAWKAYQNLSNRCQTVLQEVISHSSFQVDLDSGEVSDAQCTLAYLIRKTGMSPAQVAGALLTLDSHSLVTWTRGIGHVAPTAKGIRYGRTATK